MISYLDVNMEKFLWVPVDNDIFKKKKRKEKKGKKKERKKKKTFHLSA